MFHIYNIPHFFVFDKHKNIGYCKGVRWEILNRGDVYILNLHDERRVVASCQVKYGLFNKFRVFRAAKRLLKQERSRKPLEHQKWEELLNCKIKKGEI